MNSLTALLSRIVNAPEWRDIATAPFDRAIELAVIDGDIGVLGHPCLRHGDAWFDAVTLRASIFPENGSAGNASDDST